MKNKKIKKQKTPKQIGLTVLCWVLGIVLVVLLGGTVYIESMLGMINRDVDNSTMSYEEYQEFLNSQTETADPNFEGEEMHPDDVDWGSGGDMVENSKDIINILLIGQDRRPGEARQRSDAMILCTVNKLNRSLTLTSLMRDMYVQIPGYQDNRINVCYPLGGMKLLDDCLKKNFGIQVDGNIEVDFGGFAGIIDAVGGIDMELSQSEANHLNREYGFSLQTGMNHLNGEEALEHARNRSIGNSDFERTNRQRKVLNAVFDQVKNLSIPQLQNLLNTVLPMITTDLTNRQIMSYASDVFPLLPSLTVNSLRIPADGKFQYATIRGMSVLVPDLDGNRSLLQKHLLG